ncbi:MAG: anthranilate synthase component I family protein [Nitrospirae bacterium]|nr:anthranilate synthase component I family protein [Nitrospirota bacterium]
MNIQYKKIPWYDPFITYTKLKGTGPSFLLESPLESRNLRTSRYSFIGVNPAIVVEGKGDKIKITEDSEIRTLSGNPLEVVKSILKKREMVPVHIQGLPPFTGGAVGYLGYDIVHNFERLPCHASDDLGLPDLMLMFTDNVTVFDNLEKCGWIIGVSDDVCMPASDIWEQIENTESGIMADVPVLNTKGPLSKINVVSNLTQKEYVAMVRRCKEYISAGDIFQANLSQRLSASVRGADPLNIYRVLREINPSPFSAFIDTGSFQLISSSPERLVRLHNGVADTRPIAGTRPRGKSQVENGILMDELITSEKERAEHLMLVDLERNDLGRVCKYGSVKVDEFMALESYSHVNHIVSNVSGETRPNVDAFDLIEAVFPGGTITGVPKIRCMEIIDELEPTTRGPYTGSIGYISYTGDMDLNIIIRTFIIKDGWAHIQVGAGIVADSDPEKEYKETLYKAEALLKTLEQVLL